MGVAITPLQTHGPASLRPATGVRIRTVAGVSDPGTEIPGTDVPGTEVPRPNVPASVGPATGVRIPFCSRGQ
jgi:hypothetical protein